MNLLTQTQIAILGSATASTHGEPEPTVRPLLALCLSIPQPIRIVIEVVIGVVLIWAVKS